MSKLLIFMVLSSAAASTQTTILPTARTTLSMAAYKSIPATFAKVHPRYFTPTSSTLWMGGGSAVLYLAMNYFSNGDVVWAMHFSPHWQVGFAFLLGIGSLIVGLVLMAISTPLFRPCFSGQTLNRNTPVYVMEGEPLVPGPLPDSRENLVLPPETGPGLTPCGKAFTGNGRDRTSQPSRESGPGGFTSIAVSCRISTASSEDATGPRTSPPVGARALLCPGYSSTSTVSTAGPMAEASTPAFGIEITPSSVSMVV